LGFRFGGSGCRAYSFGFSGYGVESLMGLWVQDLGSGFRVQGLGFRVQGLGFRV
jgi:hypothetical protein